MSDDQVGFDVTDEVVIADMTEVKEQRSVLPVAQRVKMRISKASSSIIRRKACSG